MKTGWGYDLVRGQARNGKKRTCPLRQLQETHGGVEVLPYLPPEQHAKLPASAAVTAVTSCSLTTRSFFGQRDR